LDDATRRASSIAPALLAQPRHRTLAHRPARLQLFPQKPQQKARIIVIIVITSTSTSTSTSTTTTTSTSTTATILVILIIRNAHQLHAPRSERSDAAVFEYGDATTVAEVPRPEDDDADEGGATPAATHHLATACGPLNTTTSDIADDWLLNASDSAV
jgi:hypothetical protein